MSQDPNAFRKRQAEEELGDCHPRRLARLNGDTTNLDEMSYATWANTAHDGLVDTISLVVGEDDNKKVFQVHAIVLSRASPFFKAIMNPRWKEGGNKTIELPGDDPATVSLYIECCYRKHILVSEPETCKDCSISGEIACRLWVLADKFQDIVLKRRMTAYIFWRRGSMLWPGLDAVYAALEGPEDSKLLYLLADMAINYPQNSLMTVNFNELPEAFLRKLVVRLLAERGQPSERATNMTNPNGDPAHYYDDALARWSVHEAINDLRNSSRTQGYSPIGPWSDYGRLRPRG